VEYIRRVFVLPCIPALLISILLTGCSLKPGPQGRIPSLGLSGHPGEKVKPPGTDGSEAQPRLENLWQRVISLYQLEAVQHSRIEREIQVYLRNPDYLIRTQSRAEPYLHYIVEQVEKNGLPGELALLPVIESAFRPYAYSRASASGLWQFIPSTGRKYGLKQNWWYDGRRDVHKATRAALQHLQDLEKVFDHDWLLAVAAYNCGKGRVEAAIRKNKQRGRPTDFWSLRLPRETRSYVPRLLALSHLIANARKYDITIKPIADRPYFRQISLEAQIDFKQAAGMAGISLEDFYRLNPGFNQWASDPEGPYALLVPVQKADDFVNQLEQIAEKDKTSWYRHKVKRQESIEQIAAKYNTSAFNILKANKLVGKSLITGDRLIIPVSGQKLSRNHYSPNPYLPERIKAELGMPGTKIIYRIRRGDTLSGIGQRYRIRAKSIANWNSIRVNSMIRPGQRLILWPKEKAGVARTAIPSSAKSYTVRKGDSLYTIAHQFKVSMANLKKWNRPILGKYLMPGQKLAVQAR
jgi:membrane-bound lytic murein transglycosylase D